MPGVRTLVMMCYDGHAWGKCSTLNHAFASPACTRFASQPSHPVPPETNRGNQPCRFPRLLLSGHRPKNQIGNEPYDQRPGDCKRQRRLR